MSINFTIDQGNSAAKIAVWDGPEMIDQQVIGVLTDGILAGLVGRYSPERALCCSVTGNGSWLVRVMRGLGVEASLLTNETPMPLTIGYHTPSTLGPDRIAAAVGAWSLFERQSLLVVDVGSAATYDVVTPEGCFIGGNIAPGIGMRLRALRSFTARLPEVNGYGPTPPFGTDTVTAMRSGAVRGVAAEIAYYRSLLPDDTRVVLTGGWSHRLTEFLDFDVTQEPCLVTKGLLSILLYNEHKDNN